METRVALLGVIVENENAIEQVNRLLHEYRRYIIGRMGIPYTQRQVNIISIAIDAPSETISALSGKLGMLPGVNAKAVYAKLPKQNMIEKEE